MTHVLSRCYCHQQSLAVLGQLINTLNWVQAVVTRCEFLLMLGFPRGRVLWEDFWSTRRRGQFCWSTSLSVCVCNLQCVTYITLGGNYYKCRPPWHSKEPIPHYLGSNLPRCGQSRRARPVPVYGYFFKLWARSLMSTNSFKLADGHLGQWSQLKIHSPRKKKKRKSTSH